MILDGRTVANGILEDLSQRVHDLQKNFGIMPHMAVVSVGDDPATASYVAQKEKKAKEIGATVSVYRHPASVTQQELQQTIDFLQESGDVHGLILQLPIPPRLNEHQLIASIRPDLDVDGFVQGSGFVVPMASAIFKLLEVVFVKDFAKTYESLEGWLQSQTIVVIGKGPTGGAPIIDALRAKGIEPTVIDSQTEHPETLTQQADIIISCVGKMGVVTKENIKKDVILLGVGMSMTPDGKFVGDYEESVSEKASWYTPTPGGVGPVNVACLMENLVLAAENSVEN